VAAHSCPRFRQLVLFLTANLISSSLALAQRPRNQQAGEMEPPSTVVVKVQAPDGTPYLGIAEVKLFNFSGTSAGIGSMRTGEVVFSNLLIGTTRWRLRPPGSRK